MKIVKNKTSEDNREFWSHVESVAKEVGSWPRWMGNSTEEPVGDKDSTKAYATPPQKEPPSE